MPQRADAPAFHAAHFRVKLAFQVVFDADEFREVTPTQLRRQCLRYLLVRKNLGKTQHLFQISASKSTTVLRRQLSTQCVDNLLAVLRTLVLQHIFPDPLADIPVQPNQRRIDRLCNLLPRLLDQPAQIADQSLGRHGSDRFLLPRQLSFCLLLGHDRFARRYPLLVASKSAWAYSKAARCDCSRSSP